MTIAAEAAEMANPEYHFSVEDYFRSGSTDMGDLGCIMLVVHPYAGGATGRSHGSNYEISDPVAACIGSAKLQLRMLLILLSDDAKRAKQVTAEFKPQFASKEEYLSFVDSLHTSGDRIDYRDETLVTVNVK